jgi:hypothetical protein
MGIGRENYTGYLKRRIKIFYKPDRSEKQEIQVQF